MSHEIRTPMNAIIGMTTIAAAYIDDRKRVADCLEKVIESVTSIIYPQAVAKGLNFTVPLSGVTDTLLIGDSMRLNQVLLNLLSNALKFTPENGSILLEIRQLQRTDRRVRLRFTVSDTGIGMSEEFMERIFNPFEQESAAVGRKFGGTGLGMPITKNLVTLMGGIISVKSELEKGSTFIVELDFDLSVSDGAPQVQ